jgi:hypothetical protein
MGFFLSKKILQNFMMFFSLLKSQSFIKMSCGGNGQPKMPLNPSRVVVQWRKSFFYISPPVNHQVRSIGILWWIFVIWILPEIYSQIVLNC